MRYPDNEIVSTYLLFPLTIELKMFQYLALHRTHHFIYKLTHISWSTLRSQIFQ